jgi:hypothetical protein
MADWYASTELRLMAAKAVAKTLHALTGGELSLDSSG